MTTSAAVYTLTVGVAGWLADAEKSIYTLMLSGIDSCSVIRCVMLLVQK